MSQTFAVPAALQPVLRAFAESVVPETADLDDAGWQEVLDTVGYALFLRPPKLRRQVLLLLRVLDYLPVPRFGRRFPALDAAARTRVLDGLQHGPVLLLRRGIWGLRTLVMMGFYTRPQTMSDIGYRAHPRGWSARP